MAISTRETQQVQCYNHVSDCSVQCAKGTRNPMSTHTCTHTHPPTAKTHTAQQQSTSETRPSFLQVEGLASQTTDSPFCCYFASGSGGMGTRLPCIHVCVCVVCVCACDVCKPMLVCVFCVHLYLRGIVSYPSGKQ